jgi:tetratricopeptide (TPR) repeat protein
MTTTSPYAVSLPQQVNIMHLYQEAKRLFQSKLYRSVESLTLLCISASSKAETTLRVKSASATVPLVDLYELLGDAIFHQQYFKRAISYYRLAVQHKHPVGIKISSSNRHSSWIINPADGQLQFKLARSLYESGDMAQAIVEIESIPPSFVDLEILTTLGQWYKQANRAADSLRVYKQAYALAPYAMELLEIIATLKVDEAELTKAVKEYHSSRFQEHLVTSSQTTTDSASGISASTFFQASTIAASPPEWLMHLIQGLSCHHRLESEKALDHFQRLLALFPKNVFVMRLTAHAWSFHEIEDQAMSLYKQIQRIDKLYSTEMDRYAALLYRRCVQSSSGTGNAREDEVLQRLATELMDATQASSPEALISVAYFCLVRKEYEAAASFVERALSLPQVHQQHAEAWRCRGHLRGPTALNTPSAALVDFLHANAMEKDLASFVGIVETNMAMGKFRDAATAAKEMVLLYPKSARALYTLGTVMAKSPQGVRESIKAYSKALRLHPRLLDATLALCTTYLSLGHHPEAEAW